ncbi:helix-turn-helix domain-containing protein [Stappia sp. GBMRC 2046]|uniref:Helix-turn-helix domain-containing protein n=1 Tax=Stappia sediminis TaxID=2692190 RepID=A0A7X3S753_9HYPH|nr:DJ-1/PfpI family protein [Stappia sediminis]MXN64410.1 helix-turn-helix domain-containing protein [Stappia sediminis]
MTKVIALAFEDVQLLDITGPLQVFSSASSLDEAATYETEIVSLSGGPVRSSAGIVLESSPASDIASFEAATVLIPGGPGIHRMQAEFQDEMCSVIRRAASEGARIVSVCSGALLLARTGLLDGGTATTHWRWCEKLAQEHPEVHVDHDAIFSRINGKLWTSAGVTAGIDLALALVEEDHGRSLSIAVARELVVFLRRHGGQAQFSAALLRQGATDKGEFDALHAWILERLDQRMTVETLAAQCCMSPRSFARRYKDATGRTPAKAIEALRIESAARLIGETSLSIPQIATRCGFASRTHLVQAWKRQLRGSFPQR